jgi:NAD(P)H-dependent FMN reductase
MQLFLMAASLRTESVNKKLTNICNKFLSVNHQVDYANMADFDAPLYNNDIQDKEGIPSSIMNFISRIKQAQKIIISSPEYNYSIPGTLKNIIDWVSRAQPMPWKNTDILLLSASPSLVGGNRGLWHARVPLEGCGAFVYPEMFSLSDAYNAFDSEGNLKDKNSQSRLEKLINEFINH